MLIDAARTWGWRVVNIQSYRDKASGRQQVIDGRNAEKVKRYKERHRKTPADTKGHRRTPTHTHTADSDSNTDLEEELPRARALKGGRGNSEEPESPEARKERIQEAIAKFKQYRDAPSTLAMLTKTTVEELAGKSIQEIERYMAKHPGEAEELLKQVAGSYAE